jgi:hypothetical protein
VALLRLKDLKQAMRGAGFASVLGGSLLAADPNLAGGCDSCNPGCSTCQTCQSGGSNCPEKGITNSGIAITE